MLLLNSIQAGAGWPDNSTNDGGFSLLFGFFRFSPIQILL